MKRQIEFVSTIRYSILIFLAQTLLGKSCSSCGIKVVVVPGYHEHFMTQEEDASVFSNNIGENEYIYIFAYVITEDEPLHLLYLYVSSIAYTKVRLSLSDYIRVYFVVELRFE